MKTAHLMTLKQVADYLQIDPSLKPDTRVTQVRRWLRALERETQSKILFTLTQTKHAQLYTTKDALKHAMPQLFKLKSSSRMTQTMLKHWLSAKVHQELQDLKQQIQDLKAQIQTLTQRITP